MKKIHKTIREVLATFWKDLNSAYSDFRHLEYFSEIRSALAHFSLLSATSEYSPLVFLGVPFVFLLNGRLREKISLNLTLSRFLEPLMVSWMFTSIAFLDVFAFSKVVGLDSRFYSFLSFLILYVLIALVIYQKKGLNPIFFGKPLRNESTSNTDFVLE